MNCARAVIELIMLYWPHSIDVLQPERASVDGPRPIFFSSQSVIPPPVPCQEHLERSFFVDDQGVPLEFGANQCNIILILFPLEVLLTGPNPGILVRDNDVRKALKEKWKAKCIIM